MSKYRIVEVETIEDLGTRVTSITRGTVFNTDDRQALLDFIDKRYHRQSIPTTITYRVYEGSKRLHDFSRE